MEPASLASFYRTQLKEQILPFWLKHAPDDKFGGYFSCLTREGRVYNPHKIDILMQGRISWTYAWMYNEFEPEPAWLEFARKGVDFLLKHGFREDGRMYYALHQDGTPMRPPSLYHAELSSILGFSEVARATKDETLYRRARELFDRVWKVLRDPAGDWNPLLPANRPVRDHGYSMITIHVIQTLRDYREEPGDRTRIQECIATMRDCHLRPERKLLLEMTDWEGRDLTGTLGRWINPGHMIEGGIFLLHETWRHPDPEIRQMGINLIRWGFEWGWDREFGGIFNDVDAEGLPIPGKEGILADCKLWWQHAEALYGLLLAFHETGDPWFFEAYQLVHEYSFRHFADPEYGEWYGYLDRTGRPIHTAKGTDRKCCFHIGRNFLWCAKIADRFGQNSSSRGTKPGF